MLGLSMPSRDPSISASAAAKAREAWEVPALQTSVRGRLRIPSDLVHLWNHQDTDDRGLSWAIGCILTNPAASYIVGNDNVTVILGQYSATGATQCEAVVGLVQSYGYELPSTEDFEDRLTELGLLE